MRTFCQAVVATVQIVSFLLRHDTSRRCQSLEALRIAVRVGLVGPSHDVQRGQDNLEDYRATLVDDAYRIRRQRLHTYSMGIAVAVALLLTAEWLQHYGFEGLLRWLNWSPGPNFIPTLVARILHIVAGEFIGLWVEFVLGTRKLAYDDLLILDQDRWDPIERWGITSGIAVVLALTLLSNKIFQLGVGPVLLNDYNGSIKTALLLGGINWLSIPSYSRSNI